MYNVFIYIYTYVYIYIHVYVYTHTYIEVYTYRFIYKLSRVERAGDVARHQRSRCVYAEERDDDGAAAHVEV